MVKSSCHLFSEYLEKVSFLRIEKGSLTLDGNITKGAGQTQPLNAALDLTVEDLQVEDTHKGSLLMSLEALNLDDIQVDKTRKRVSIALADLVKPKVFVEMSQNKKINLADLVKPKTPTQDAKRDKETDETAEWVFGIKKIALKDGTTHYVDKSIKPVFETGLYELSLSVGQINTDGRETIPFFLRSKIDRFAPFSIKGSLEPLNKQPGFTFTSELKGLEMPRLSPYSAVYIGYNLKSGKLSLGLDYGLHNGRLKGKNHIVAKDLYLGEEVPSEKAINAPVALGLALLRDVKGIIDLDVEISGDLDNPDFNVSGIVLKALVNIITKAAAAPFKLLGDLVGGREDLGEISFAGGHAELNKDNQERLKQLGFCIEAKTAP